MRTTRSQRPFHSATVIRNLKPGVSLMEACRTADRISELVAAGESETLEFKRTTGQRIDTAKTVCAHFQSAAVVTSYSASLQLKAPWLDSRSAMTRSRR